MIGPVVREIFLENKEIYLIPADNVASLMPEHSLEHALLVLTQIGYTKIPVVDKKDHFVGLVGLANVMKPITSLNEINSTMLEGMQVGQVMETEVPTVPEDWELEDVLSMLVNQAFLPVVGKDQVFKGIITRKEILKTVNALAHDLERDHVVLPNQKEVKVN